MRGTSPGMDEGRAMQEQLPRALSGTSAESNAGAVEEDAKAEAGIQF